MVTPTTTANATLTTATRIEACTATRTRENTSRPSSSVPNQWSPLGGCSAFGTSMSLTPNGAIQWRGDRDEHHDREHDRAGHGDRVACQQSQRRQPGLLLDGCGFGMGIRRHDSRILGSTNAYRTSTMRLMSRNSAAISSTAPWMTG